MAVTLDVTLMTDSVLKKYSKSVQNLYVSEMQVGMAQWMGSVKMASIKQIIPRTVDPKVPASRCWMYQPSTPGKLTSRSGRMIRGLMEGGGYGQQRKAWLGFGKRRVATNSNVYKTLNGKIAATEKGNSISHMGTYTIFVRPNSDGLAKMKGSHKPTRNALAARYRWETGIRGETRKYMTPAAMKKADDLKVYVERNTDAVFRRL